MNVPLPFLPNAKPRNLKFRIANTLTTLLLSLFTVSFKFSSRYAVLVPSSLFEVISLFDSSTMSSAQRTHGTPLLPPHDDTLAFGYILPATERIRDFHPLECALAGRTNKPLEHGDFPCTSGLFYSSIFIQLRITPSPLRKHIYIPNFN